MTLISVIIPTCNRPDQLKNSVQSVLRQDMEGIEVIVIDDASNAANRESNLEVVQAMSNIQLLVNPKNQGVSASRNKGLDVAKGEFVMFLDDDDELKPNMLGTCLDALQDETLALVSCQCQIVANHWPEEKVRAYNQRMCDSHYLYNMTEQPAEHLMLYHPQVHTFLARKSAIGERRFDTRFAYGEDIMFWLSLVETGCKSKKVNYIGCLYHLHSFNETLSTSYSSKKRFYKHILQTSVSSSAVINLCNIKLAVLGIKNGDLCGSIHALVKCINSPQILYRHLKFYFRHWI